jgi:hypothetical protein
MWSSVNFPYLHCAWWAWNCMKSHWESFHLHFGDLADTVIQSDLVSEFH